MSEDEIPIPRPPSFQVRSVKAEEMQLRQIQQSPLYPQAICSKPPSGCMNPQIVPNCHLFTYSRQMYKETKEISGYLGLGSWGHMGSDNGFIWE